MGDGRLRSERRGRFESAERGRIGVNAGLLGRSFAAFLRAAFGAQAPRHCRRLRRPLQRAGETSADRRHMSIRRLFITADGRPALLWRLIGYIAVFGGLLASRGPLESLARRMTGSNVSE